MSMNTSSPIRVAIVGAGIGGLSLAVALHRMDKSQSIHVDIYEQKDQAREVGAGFSFWARTWEIMKRLDMDTTLATYLLSYPDGKPSLGFEYRKSDQSDGFTFYDFIINGGIMPFHRGDVQQALLKALPSSVQCHFSRHFVSYKEIESSVVLEFQDGSTATCDILVGADGIRSPVRKELVTESLRDQKKSADPVWSGTVAYRGLIPSEVLAREMPGHRALTSPIMYCGKNKHLVVYPIQRGQQVNVAAFSSDFTKEGTRVPGEPVANVTKEELISCYAGWEEEVLALVRCIEKPSRWAIQALNPLQNYASGRVVLIGDAAHAMTPHLGSGAGQAIEDAYILASMIIKASQTGASVQRVTEAFSQVRQPFANMVLNTSRKQGRLTELDGPGYENIQEGDGSVSLSQLQQLSQLLGKGMEWIWTTSVESDRERALAML